MSFQNDIYWAMIEARSPKQSIDRNWRCLCCRDAGIVDDVLLARLTGALLPGEWRETSAPAKRCVRPGCYAADGLAPGGMEQIGADICQWLHTSAAAEMQETAPAPEKVVELISRLKLATVPDRDFSTDRILAKEAAKSPPIVEKISFSREPDPLVTMPGFEVGETIECRFPEWYDDRDRKEAARAYPWGETGEVLGFRREKSHVGNREKLYAIVEINGEIQRLTADMMMHTDTDTDF